jgi:hypothetical protein
MSAKCEKKLIYKLKTVVFKAVLSRHERLLRFVAILHVSGREIMRRVAHM